MPTINWRFAALCEQIYVRDPVDQALQFEVEGQGLPGFIREGTDLRGVIDANPFNPHDFTFVPGEGYYYSPRGFVARVVQDSDGTYVIVFRGLDGANFSIPDFLLTATGLRDGGTDLDTQDALTCRRLGIGQATGASQSGDAIALARAVIENLANGDPSRVKVVGQSMGGGLAGIVSAVLNPRLTNRVRPRFPEVGRSA